MSLRRIKIIKNKIERKIYHYRFLKKIDVHDTIFMVMKHTLLVEIISEADICLKIYIKFQTKTSRLTYFLNKVKKG